MSARVVALHSGLPTIYGTSLMKMSNKRAVELSRQQSQQASQVGSSGSYRSQSNSSTHHGDDTTQSRPRHADTIRHVGSKASSPVETTTVEFQFLNFSHPSEAKTSQHRRQVRSHVTRQQHQRDNAQKEARRTQSLQAEEVSDRVEPGRAHAASFPSEQPSSLELPGASGSKPGSPRSTSQASSPGASPTLGTAPHGLDLGALYPEAWQQYVPLVMVRPSPIQASTLVDLTHLTGVLYRQHDYRHCRRGPF